MDDTPDGVVPGIVIEVTTHHFKNNITEYLNQLRKGEVDGIIIKRYRRRVAFLTAAGPGARASVSHPRGT